MPPVFKSKRLTQSFNSFPVASDVYIKSRAVNKSNEQSETDTEYTGARDGSENEVERARHAELDSMLDRLYKPAQAPAQPTAQPAQPPAQPAQPPAQPAQPPAQPTAQPSQPETDTEYTGARDGSENEVERARHAELDSMLDRLHKPAQPAAQPSAQPSAPSSSPSNGNVEKWIEGLEDAGVEVGTGVGYEKELVEETFHSQPSQEQEQEQEQDQEIEQMDVDSDSESDIFDIFDLW